MKMFPVVTEFHAGLRKDPIAICIFTSHGSYMPLLTWGLHFCNSHNDLLDAAEWSGTVALIRV